MNEEQSDGAGGRRDRERCGRETPSAPACSTGGGGNRERLVPTQDRPLELLHGCTRLETQLGGKLVPNVRVGAECLGLPAGAIEREHQLATETLAQRLLCDERLELGDERLVPSKREVRVDPLLERQEPQLFEALDLRLGEGLVREVRQRLASPQRERLAQALGGLGGPALDVRAPAVLYVALEPPRVDLLGVDLKQVGARTRDQHPGSVQRLSQSRDLVVEAVAGRVGGLPAPELVDQPVARDDLVGVEQEKGKQAALFGAAELDDALAQPNLNRPEEQKLHLPPSLRTLPPPVQPYGRAL